jgi:hypothetical protein
MCYYSINLPNTRDAKKGEDLTIGQRHGHHVLEGADHKVVCVRDDTTLHIEQLELSVGGRIEFDNSLTLLRQIGPRLGKPVSGRFVEYRIAQNARAIRTGHFSSDAIMIDGLAVHLWWLAEGTKCYIGPKKVDLTTALGVTDPSIALDHGPQRDDAPTHHTMLAKIDGLCSITR